MPTPPRPPSCAAAPTPTATPGAGGVLGRLLAVRQARLGALAPPDPPPPRPSPTARRRAKSKKG